MADNRTKEVVTFHYNSSVINAGYEYDVPEDANTINFDIKPSEGATYSISFEAKVSEDSDWKPVGAININTFDISTAATTDDIYMLDVIAIGFVRANLTAITGTISVYGRVAG